MMINNKKKKFCFSEIERHKIVDKGIATLWSEEGKDIVSYLTDERHFTKDVVKKFQIGYCPNRVQHPLRNRVISPIYDIYNNLIFLSTRIPRTKNAYTFLHESISNKGLYLFGIHIALPNIIKTKKAIIVEGEFDVLYLHSQGINIAVAACGSALSIFQITMLLRYCSEIYYVTDGDKAGKSAQERFHTIYDTYNFKSYYDNYGSNLIGVCMPDNMDPDDYIDQFGKQEFIKYLLKSRDEQYNI